MRNYWLFIKPKLNETKIPNPSHPPDINTTTMVMSTRIETNTMNSCVNSTSRSMNMNKELTDHEAITIDEFLNKAEDIAMSSISVDVNYGNVEVNDDPSRANEQRSETNPFSPIAIDEALVQEIIDNDDRLHREVDEFMNMHSMSMDEDEIDLDTFDYSALMGSCE